jgi:hypothetical protein
MSESQIMLGRLLAEILMGTTRQQYQVDAATLFGLRHGFERVIDEMLSGERPISRETEDAIVEVVDSMAEDTASASALELERILLKQGISRQTILAVLRYLFLKGQDYEDIVHAIERSSRVPSEYRNLTRVEVDGPAADLFPIEIVEVDDDGQMLKKTETYTNTVPRLGEFISPDRGQRQVVIEVVYRVSKRHPERVPSPTLTPFVIIQDGDDVDEPDSDES